VDINRNIQAESMECSELCQFDGDAAASHRRNLPDVTFYEAPAQIHAAAVFEFKVDLAGLFRHFIINQFFNLASCERFLRLSHQVQRISRSDGQTVHEIHIFDQSDHDDER